MVPVLLHILIVCRHADSRAESFSQDVERLLIQHGHSVYKCKKNLLESTDFLFDPDSSPDLVVVIGGDGTILLATQRMPVQVPVVGINYGEVGFLADIEPDDTAELVNRLLKPLQVEARMRIELRLNGDVIGTALNEALIVTDRPAKMLKFLIHINGKIAERFRADGLIISTPTGSTAYAMSAGGPIVDPRVEGFLMVPLAPFMLSNRPHLIDSSRTVSVTLEATKPAKLVIDGQTEIHLEKNCVVELTKSDSPALFLEAGQNFFEKINRKLRHL
ncbi:NAD(+)/NADH kinase [Methanospirillum sp.]